MDAQNTPVEAKRTQDPQIEAMFTYHKANEKQQKSFEQITSSVKELAYLIDEVCPPSREKSLAITKLQELRMMANAAIAIHGNEVQEPRA